MLRKAVFLLLVASILSSGSFAQTAPAPQTKINVIIGRESVRFAPQELAVEMRLVVTDQSGAELYDSGALPVAMLDWLLIDGKGEAVKGGLYLYTLTIKDAAGAVGERRGYLIVNRAGDGDRVYIATGDKVGIGAANEAAQVTVVGGPEATVGGAELSTGASANYVAPGRSLSGLSGRGGLQRDAQGRPVSAPDWTSQPGALSAPNGTFNRLAKFNSDGASLIDSALTESGGSLWFGAANKVWQVTGQGQSQTYDTTAGLEAGYAAYTHRHAANLGGFPRTFFLGYGTLAPEQVSNYGFYIASGQASGGTQKQAFIGVSTNADVKQAASKQMFISQWTTVGGISIMSAEDPASGQGTDLFLGGSNQLGANAPFYIKANGNVGVGTSSPAEKLHIEAGSLFLNGETQGLIVDASGNQRVGLMKYPGQEAMLVGSANSASVTPVRLGRWEGGTIKNPTTVTTDLAIDSTGIVRIGNTNLNAGGMKLYVAGVSTAVHAESFHPSGAAVVGVNTAGGYAGSFVGKVIIHSNLEVLGNVCAQNVSCSSDARLKQHVRSLDYGLSQLMRLRPVRWQWKDHATKQLSFGLIAQEVEPILPELILRDTAPNKPLGLNYLGLVPVVIKAIQEQQTALEQKDATIKALQQRNAELDARLAAVEQTLQQLLGQPGQAQPTKRQQ